MKSSNAIHIYCTDKIRTKLEILAQANHRTMSSEVQALIEQAYKLYLSDQTKAKNELKG